MPELAEVEFYRSRWDPGVGGTIQSVAAHLEKRIFRGVDQALFVRELPGRRLLASEARGKQMLFRFSGGLWLGVHLGMTGKLSCQSTPYLPGKHDHLVLFQKKRALVFNDARQFGRVRLHSGKEAPDWWEALPPSILSRQFTLARCVGFLERHPRLAIKTSLLLQEGFPGVGNWMADEILWRAGIAPTRLTGELRPADLKMVWKQTRAVCRQAVRIIGKDFSDPPRSWLFHERWKRRGFCPIHKTPLSKKFIGGRSSAWCSKCQPS